MGHQYLNLISEVAAQGKKHKKFKQPTSFTNQLLWQLPLPPNA